jgi:hypothetical protein
MLDCLVDAGLPGATKGKTIKLGTFALFSNTSTTTTSIRFGRGFAPNSTAFERVRLPFEKALRKGLL